MQVVFMSMCFDFILFVFAFIVLMYRRYAFIMIYDETHYKKGTGRIKMARKRITEARSPEYEELGRKLAEARDGLDLSQAEAAKLIGISQGTYSGYETGTRRIRLPMLRRIADAYGVTVDWLIGTERPKAERVALNLTDQEYDLIVKFRELSDAEQGMILRSVGINI